MLTRTFNKIITACCDSASSNILITSTDVAGATAALEANYTRAHRNFQRMKGSLAELTADGYGTIVFGTGTDSLSVDNTSITLIDDTLFNTLAFGGTNDYVNGNFNLMRKVTYTGASPITINEIGYYFKAGNNIWLIARELIDGGLSLNNGDTFTATVTLGG